MNTVPDSSTEFEGNTKSQTPPKRQVSPAKNWCFTFNNPNQYLEVPENYDLCEYFGLLLKEKKVEYIFQLESGEKGTQHLQGYISHKTKFRPSALKLPKQIHWEKSRGSRDDNINYCSKEDTRIKGPFTNMKIERKPKILSYSELRPWQKTIVNICDEEPDNRTIYWIYDEEGGKGKTELCKYIAHNYNATLVNGSTRDSIFGLTHHKENTGLYPDIILWNLPRSQKGVSYSAIEQIKDGIFYNRKYESGMVLMANPHIFIFANWLPKMEELTFDRWNITTL